MALPCLNCGDDIPSDGAKCFAGVLVCPVCADRAERLEKNLQQELQRMFSMTRESIRIALVQGKLHFGGPNNQETSKTDLLKQIMRIEEMKEQSSLPPQPAKGPDGRPVRSRRRVS